MKRSRWILGAVMLGVVGSSAGCNKAAPTEPGSGVLDAAAVGAPANGNSGAWSGKITFFPYYGNSVVLPCAGTELINVFLTQDGARLTGQFHTACNGIMEIDGILSGHLIGGSLDGPSSMDYGKISGSIYLDLIRFQALKVIDEDEGGPKGNGTGPFRTAQVELRQAPQRIYPLAVDRGRSPRLLPGR